MVTVSRSWTVYHQSWVMGHVGQFTDGSDGSWVTKCDPFSSSVCRCIIAASEVRMLCRQLPQVGKDSSHLLAYLPASEITSVAVEGCRFCRVKVRHCPLTRAGTAAAITQPI